MTQMYIKNKGFALGWIVIGIIVLILISAILIGNFFRKVEKIEFFLKNGQRISFLVLAQNEHKQIKGAFVLIFQPTTNKCAIISILPKTYITGSDKDNFTLEEAFQKKITYEELLSGISNLIGIDINYYFIVDKKNFIRIIDMIGGVEVYSEGIKKPELKVNIPSGLLLLDGDKACEYFSLIINKRDPYDYGYDQLKHIQNFMKGFLKLKNNFLEQFNKEIMSTYFYKSLITNMNEKEFIIFYKEIVNRFNKGIKDYSIGIVNMILFCDKKELGGYEFVYLPKNSGKWIKREVEDAIAEIKKINVDNNIGHIVVEILNGTESVGLAGRTAEYLSTFGLDILNVENADSNDYENTVVISYGDEIKARKLADLIKCTKIITKEDIEDRKIDVTLIIGKDFDGKIVR